MMTLERLHDLGYRELFGYDFALINPVRVREERWKDLPVVPLQAPAFDAQPHLVPRLLPLAALNADQQVELLKRNDRQCVEAGQPMFCALLASPAETRSLAASLGSRMLLDAPTGQTVWLRFHDPRVFSALAWWLDQDQIGCLMGQVQGWAWYEPRDANWHRLKCPSVSGPRRLRLNKEQWDRLERQPLVNRTLKESGRTPPLGQSLRNLVELVDAQLIRAAASGLAEATDLSRFAAMTARHGETWINHPVATRALSAAAEGRQTLAAGLASLGHAELQQWARASAVHKEEHA